LEFLNYKSIPFMEFYLYVVGVVFPFKLKKRKDVSLGKLNYLYEVKRHKIKLDGVNFVDKD
jgi:hypothetical protein